MSDDLRIKSIAKRNGITLTLVGVLGLMLSLIFIEDMTQAFGVVGYFVVCVFLVTTILGIGKWTEPEHSILVADGVLEINHRYGRVQIPLTDIVRVDVPSMVKGIDRQHYPFVGIKLKNIESFVDAAPLRLISKTLSEQRNLYHTALSNERDLGIEEFAIEDTHFEFDSGKTCNGLKAMMAFRMNEMNQMLGFHWYVSESSLDRSPFDMAGLIRERVNAQQQAPSNNTL